MKHFLSLRYISKKELLEIIDLSLDIKNKFKQNISSEYFKGKTLGLIFDKSSTRTRVSLEVGAYQLGGHSLFLSKNDLQLGRGESVEDTARVLSGMVDMVAIRTTSQEMIENFANNSTIPIINALSDDYHPTQMIADYMSIKEHNKENTKICFIGDGNNMVNSWIYLSAILGLEFCVATPKNYQVKKEIIKTLDEIPNFDSSKITFTTNPEEAVNNAEVVMSDTWVSMNQDKNKIKDFDGFCVDENLMKQANKNAIFMHCLPAYRGMEVSKEVIDGNQSIIFEQSENKLHANKGIIAWLS